MLDHSEGVDNTEEVDITQEVDNTENELHPVGINRSDSEGESESEQELDDEVLATLGEIEELQKAPQQTVVKPFGACSCSMTVVNSNGARIIMIMKICLYSSC